MKLRPRTAAAVTTTSEADKNLNLINNNKTSRDASEEQKDEKASKRRSYHPQDFLSKVFKIEIQQEYIQS